MPVNLRQRVRTNILCDDCIYTHRRRESLVQLNLTGGLCEEAVSRLQRTEPSAGEAKDASFLD